MTENGKTTGELLRDYLNLVADVLRMITDPAERERVVKEFLDGDDRG